MSMLMCRELRIVTIAGIDTHARESHISYMVMLLCCSMRIVIITWICLTHMLMNYTHGSVTVLCTENCAYCINWHTCLWFTHMSVLLCCALRIVNIAWMDTHVVNWPHKPVIKCILKKSPMRPCLFVTGSPSVRLLTPKSPVCLSVKEESRRRCMPVNGRHLLPRIERRLSGSPDCNVYILK